MKRIEDRFWPKVDKTETCWLWTGAKNKAGYGNFGSGGRYGRTLGPHRVAYELCIGPIPPGMHIDHMCHNKLCVNPQHLRLATNKQNHENYVGVFANNTSGVRGVRKPRHGNVWVTEVQHNGQRYIKRFADFDEACAYVVELRNQLFTHNDADRIAS